jgi:transcriptional regulator with XRE-family HTH domain
MSHEKLADGAGIHRSTVSRTERGLMNPTLYVLHAMSAALKLQFSDVVIEAEKNSARKSG